MNKYENLIPTQTHVIPLKEKHSSNFRFGNKVVYIPHHLLIGLREDMVQNANLGYVTGWSVGYVFVRYNQGKNNQCKATNPKDLYWLDNRQDLKNLITFHKDDV